MTAIEMPSRGLHLVSRTVLSQFCDDSRLLMRFNVRHPHTPPKLRSPSAVGYTTKLIPENTIEFEGLWQSMETNFPPAVAAVKDRTILENVELLDVMRDCVAVHLARSNTIYEVSQVARQKAIESTTSRMANHPDLVSPAGLVPGGPISAALIAEMKVAQVVEDNRFGHDEQIPSSMMRHYGQILRFLKRQPVEVVSARGGEFIIGDTPAHTFHNERGFDVPLLEANTVFMPVSRHHLIAFGPANKYAEVDCRVIDWVNTHQVRSARQMVMWHPDADLTDFARHAIADAGAA